MLLAGSTGEASQNQLKAVLKVFPGFCIPIHRQGRWEEAGNPGPAPRAQSCSLHRARHDTSGLDRAAFRGGLPKDGPLLAQKKNFRSGFFGKWLLNWPQHQSLLSSV